MTDPNYPGEPQPESRFFRPTARCPHPERWTSTDGDSTEIEVSEFLGGLARALQPDLVVELGAAWGQTTRQIIKALDRNGHGHLYALETDVERAAYARERVKWMAGRPPGYAIVEESSLTWEPLPGSPPIDFLFSDTRREIRTHELIRFAPFMRRGGIAAVHDSGWDMGPLRGWLEELVVKPGLARAIDLPTPRGLTLLEMNPGTAEHGYEEPR